MKGFLTICIDVSYHVKEFIWGNEIIYGFLCPIFGRNWMYSIFWNLAWGQPRIMTSTFNFAFRTSWTSHKWLNIIFPGCAFSWLILFAYVAGRLLVPTLEFWRNQVAVYDAVCKFFSFMHNCLALNCTCPCTFNTLIGGNLSNFHLEFVDIITTRIHWSVKILNSQSHQVDYTI